MQPKPMSSALKWGLGLGAAALTVGGVALAARAARAATSRRSQARLEPEPEPEPYTPEEPEPEPEPGVRPDLIQIQTAPEGLFNAAFQSGDARFRRSALAGEGLIGFFQADRLPVRIAIDVPQNFLITLEELDSASQIAAQSDRTLVVEVADFAPQTEEGFVLAPSFSGRISWRIDHNGEQIGNDNSFEFYVVEKLPYRALMDE